MTYRQSIEFLSSLIDYERWAHHDYEFKLENYIAFLRKAGTPNHKLKRVVLVAGTKGKGSTAAMLAAILKAHGERVGLYTSPHLLDYRERIKVDGRMISQGEFAGILDRLKPIIENHEPRITFFEALTTLAFFFFLEEKTSVNVLEIGLGGRLDATNVTDPELSAITRIGYDHTHMLGRTLKSITREKCGILREGKRVVVAAQRPQVKAVIKKIVSEKGATGICWQEDFSARLVSETGNSLQMSYAGKNLKGDFSIPLAGAHQVENAAAALAAAEFLVSEVNLSLARKSLRLIRVPARIEVIGEAPTIILDMSHNPESALTLRKVLDKHFPHHSRRILLAGTTQQKDKRGIFKNLAGFFTEIYVTQAGIHRAEPKENLLALCRQFNEHCRAADSVKEGIHEILPCLNEDDLLVIAGSVYVAGEALESLKAGKRTGQW